MPPSPAADRNLLLGILALQMDFIARDQLVAAMHAWVLEKSKPLGQLLLEQQALTSDTHALLEALVQKHLALHGNDVEKSLAAVSSVGSVRKDLENIADPDVQASLVNVSAARARDHDPYATASMGIPTSAGTRFHILRPHAKGGLGQVSVALDQELHREVALKEIQERHADNQESRSRFMLEAEITGGLEHPGIVPVYGLGTYADGRPFYAMRFIRGDSLQDAIKRYHQREPGASASGERTLELRKLLGRFIDVCQAMQYAHDRGVLHRDLKPGNIMLGRYGETLVVDWGLAKSLDKPGEPGASAAGAEEPQLRPWSASGSAETLAGTAVGTPAFMSPEQAAGRLDLLGPASDVYSLGATLYALLTGKPSVEGHEIAVVLTKVQRGDFPRPRQLQPDVNLALEAICVKAMALKPGDRYASPRTLADDLERWLGDEPVRAWPEPMTVKAGRWMRRHKPLVSGAAAALLVGVIALSASAVWYKSQQAEAARKQLVEEAEALRKQALSEEKVRRGLDQSRQTRGELHAVLKQPGGVQELLNQPARWQAQIKSSRADWQRASDHAEAAVDPNWTNQLQTLDKELARDQADFELAQLLEKIRLDTSTLVEGKFDHARAEPKYLAAFEQAGLAIAPGRQSEVARLIQQSPIKDQLLAALDHWAWVAYLNKNSDLSSRLLEVARLADSDPWRDQVRDVSLWQKGPAMEKLAEEVRADRKFLARLSPQMLRLVYHGLPTGETQIAWLRMAQALHPADFWINFSLGSVLRESGKAADAVGFYRVALAIRPNNSTVYNNLGFSLRKTQDLPGAIDAYHRALALDPQSATAWHNLGNALYDKKDFPAAIDAYNHVLAIDPKCVGAWYGLAFALRDNKDLPAAIAAHNKGRSLDANIATAWSNFGDALRDPRRLPETIDAVKKAAFGSDSSQAQTWFNLGNALHEKNDLAGAIDAYQKAISLDPKDVASWNNLGNVLRDKNDLPAAIDAYNHALAVDPKYAIARNNLGSAEKLLALEKRLPDVLQGETASAADLLALADLCRRHLKRYRDAAELYAKAFAADPNAAVELGKTHRYNAACAAALAAAGKGTEADKLEEKDQTRLRKQAFDWLQADLAVSTRLLETNPVQVHMDMRHWQRDADLAGLRDDQELAKLPADERAAWKQFWGKVESLGERARVTSK